MTAHSSFVALLTSVFVFVERSPDVPTRLLGDVALLSAGLRCEAAAGLLIETQRH